MAISIRASAPRVDLATPGVAPRRTVGPWLRAARRLLRDRLAVTAAVILALIAAVACVAPLVLQIDPYQQSLMDALQPPGTVGHPLGTDQFGRDVLLWLVDGARVSLLAGLIAVAIAVSLGGAIGLLSGYFGGCTDDVLMRLIDVKLAFPGILAALVIVTVLGGGLDKALVAVGIGALPRYARVVRASVMATRHEVYVEAGRSLGASHARIMFAHIVPQVLGPVITLATLGAGHGHSGDGLIVIPGAGRAAADRRMGAHALGESQVLARGVVADGLPRRVDHADGAGHQRAGDGVRDALDPRLSVEVD